MYSVSIDNLSGHMVGVHSPFPKAVEDDDFGQLCTSITKQQSLALFQPELIFILDIQPDCPMPNAIWRRRFAETRERLRRPLHFRLVSQSPIIRGVVTAVNWLKPPLLGLSLIHI